MRLSARDGVAGARLRRCITALPQRWASPGGGQPGGRLGDELVHLLRLHRVGASEREALGQVVLLGAARGQQREPGADAVLGRCGEWEAAAASLGGHPSGNSTASSQAAPLVQSVLPQDREQRWQISSLAPGASPTPAAAQATSRPHSRVSLGAAMATSSTQEGPGGWLSAQISGFVGAAASGAPARRRRRCSPLNTPSILCSIPPVPACGPQRSTTAHTQPTPPPQLAMARPRSIRGLPDELLATVLALLDERGDR